MVMIMMTMMMMIGDIIKFLLPMAVTVVEIVTFFKDEQPSAKEAPDNYFIVIFIVMIMFMIVMMREIPIDFTPVGMLMDVKAVHPRRTEGP